MKEYQYILTYGATVETLGFNPAGWDKLGITWMRHEVYHSVLRSFTLSLRFTNITKGGVTGGYQLIKHAYDTDGIYAEVSIEIKKRNPDTNDYDSLYTGVLDFTPGRWSIDRDLFFEIGINDSSILQKFISRDENEINLFTDKTIDNVTITPPTPIYTLLTPVDIVVKTFAICDISDSGSFPYKTFCLMNPTYSRNEIVDIIISSVPAGETPQATVYTNNSVYTKRFSFLYDANINYSGYLKATPYDFMLDVSLSIQYSWELFDETNTHVSSFVFYAETIAFNPLGETINYTDTIDYAYSGILPPQYSLEVTVFMTLNNVSSVSNSTVTRVETLDIKFTEKTPGQSISSAESLKSFTALNTALAITTNQVNALDADVMESGGDLENDMVMNGLQIRKYPSPKVNVNFRDLFKSFDAIANLGVWYDKVNNKFIIKEKSYFFDTDTKLFDVTDVNKFKIQPLVTGYYSKIEGGYDNTGGYEKVQGALEFAVKREYSTSAQVKETKNIQSKYRFDSVGIEDLRTKLYIEKASEDSNDDNEIFIVRTEYITGEEAGYYPILPTLGSPEYLGMDVFYSYYNTMLTPRQNAVKWGNVLNACAYRNINPFQAQKTDKQFELAVDGVDENSNIELSELASRLFIPELYTFESYLTPANITTLLANPHGYIQFVYRGINYSGFINKIELTDDNRKAIFELIARDDEVIYRTFESGNNHIFENGNQKING